ncbi:MAG: hypothetical protein ACXVWU_08055 [Nocardioides sp.]
MTEQPAPGTPAFTSALVAELAKKTGVCWLRYEHDSRAGTVTERRPAWHLWLDDALLVVSGGDEQPLPGIEHVERVEVTLRSKDNGGRLVTWAGRRSAVRPEDEDWDAVTAALVADRLNVPDLATAARGWAATSVVSRIVPTGELVEQPGALDDSSHAATPVVSPATTRGALPRILHRRVRRRPKLS